LLSPFSAGTQRRIEELLPPLAIRTNPVDMGPAWYDSDAIKGIVQSVLDDRNIDAILLFIMFASANSASVGILSEFLLERRRDKPILSCFSAPGAIWENEIKRLEQSGIPNYPTPERAARSLVNLIKFKKLKEKGITHGNR
jgi:acetate---CoA ligase (ADP-forming)